MAKRDAKFYDAVLNLADADSAATGRTIDVRDFRHLVLSFAFTAFTGTVKISGSIEDTAPAFGSAQSATNMWDYVQSVDLQSGLAIDGDTGIAVAGASSDFRLVEVNTNGLAYITVTATAKTAGAVLVKAKVFDNQ
jgi:hypothetical protein